MFNVIALGFRPRHQGAMLRKFSPKITQRLPKLSNISSLFIQVTIGINETPVIGHIHQGAVRMLAMNFSQASRQFAEADSGSPADH